MNRISEDLKTVKWDINAFALEKSPNKRTRIELTDVSGKWSQGERGKDA